MMKFVVLLFILKFCYQVDAILPCCCSYEKIEVDILVEEDTEETVFLSEETEYTTTAMTRAKTNANITHIYFGRKLLHEDTGKSGFLSSEVITSRIMDRPVLIKLNFVETCLKDPKILYFFVDDDGVIIPVGGLFYYFAQFTLNKGETIDGAFNDKFEEYKREMRDSN